jgi:chaperonin cofactor prefoldin
MVGFILHLIVVLMEMKNKIKILEEQNKDAKIRISNMQDILYEDLERKAQYESECG